VALAGGGSEPLAGADQHGFVVVQPGQQQVGMALRADAVLRGQGAAVAFHLLGAEQLRAQRLFRFGPGLSRAAPRERTHAAQPQQGGEFADVQSVVPAQAGAIGSSQSECRGEAPVHASAVVTLRRGT